MQLSKTALREFKEIYEQLFGRELPDTELLECALRVARLIQLLIRNHQKRTQGK